MFFLISKGIREFCKNMVDNPHDWIQGHYEFTNIKHPDIRVWTCNGPLFVSISGNHGLSFLEKIWVLQAVKLTTARKLLTKQMQPEGKEGGE